VANDPRGIVVRLPPRFWLLVSLRRIYRRMTAEPQAWTYRLPRTVGAAKRLEFWLAEVDLQAKAEERRRAWTASDAEWNDVASPAVTALAAPELAIVTLPTDKTGPAVLDLLSKLGAGATLSATIEEDGVRRYRLEPRGYLVRTAVAERAIREQLIVPGNDGLLGPEFSQTWRGPTPDEIALVAIPAAKAKTNTKRRGKPRAASATVCPVSNRA
jgi:hypothetical protein